MKKVTLVALIIFGIIATSVLTAGLLSYEKNKLSGKSNQGFGLAKDKVKDVINTLNQDLLALHSTEVDYWMILECNVYDLSAYFGLHPGGNSTMSSSCGKDGGSAYQAKGGEGKDHSVYDKSLLDDYYIGNLGVTISKPNTTSESNTTGGTTINTTTSNNLLNDIITKIYPGATSISGKQRIMGFTRQNFC